jgi:regulator of cell morphogenesis and NO signaling
VVLDVLFTTVMTITEDTLIADIATRLPSSVRVFQRHGVDFCCGGKRPLGAACEQLGLSVADLKREIDGAATPRDNQLKWTDASLRDLTRHIVATYHDALREELPRLAEMAARVSRVHGPKAPELLARLEATIRELSDDLVLHMRKEEQGLFPAICALDRHGPSGIPLAQAIRVLESDHDRAGELLSDLRVATNNFTPPDWACATTRSLYWGLADLEWQMHMHVHLENNVLFPKALALATVFSGSGQRATAASRMEH